MLKDYLKQNIDELQRVVNEINSYDGTLDYLVVYENEDWFFDEFFYNKPNEAVRAVAYGDYKYTDDYVKFNGYGNLESFDEWEYKKLLIDNVDQVIEQLYKNKNYIDLSEELESILEEEE